MKDGGLRKYILGTGREVPLPSTRREAFAFYGKEKFGTMILLNLITALLAAPSVIWLYASNYRLSQLLSEVAEGDTAAYSSIVVSYALLTYSVLAVLLLILFIGLSGVFETVKKIAFNQRVTVRDFFTGVKENWLRFVLFGAVFGVSLFFVCFNSYYYDVISISPIIKGIFSALGICWIVFLCVFGTFYCTGTVVYKYKTGQLIKNSFLLTFTRFIGNLAVTFACCVLPVAAAFIPAPFQIIVLGLGAVLCPAFAVLAVTCRCNYLYDIYINPTLGEEFVGIGLRKTKD